MTKYAVAHHDLITGDLNLLVIEDAANEVEACAKALVDIDPSYDYTALVSSSDMEDFYNNISDDECITAMPV